MLLACAWGSGSVMASAARTTGQPCSWAARGGLDTDAGRDTGENGLGDAEVTQVGVHGGVVERSPAQLGDPW